MMTRVATPAERAEAFAFLRENIFAAVATMSPEGRPQLAFMYYAVDKDFNLYIMTQRKSRKCANMTANGAVAVAIGDEVGTTSVQLEGNAKEVKEVAEMSRRAEEIFRSPRLASMYMGKKKLKFLPAMEAAADPVKNALFVIKPGWLRLLRVNEKSGESEFLNVIS